MRKNNFILRTLFLILLSHVVINTNAQTGLNFQGVARTTNNVILASQAITIKLSILQGSASGTAEYTETRRVTTNAQGLFTAVMGDTGAISTLGNFTTINWKLTPKFLKIEMDAAAGTNFITMGTTQFQYVAYSQFAKSVDAENIVGIVPVTLGGTGVNSLTGLKTALTLNNVNNTTDLTKPISTLTQAALDLKSSLTDTSKYTKQIYSDSALVAKQVLIGLKLNAADTSKYTKQTYSDSALLTKLKISDTTAMLSSRIARDTLNLSNRINLKANATDVSTSLALKENISNKSTAVDLGGTTPSDILFPTQKAVKDYVTANNSGGGVADGGITTIKLADAAVTDAKINTVSGSKVIGNITGNAATATLATTATTAGNITATTNTTLTSLSNLATVGTITSGVWSGTAVAVEKGGTGATNKVSGFDALSPLSASGDIIYGGASGTGTRLVKGTDGQLLSLASGIPTWTTPSTPTVAVFLPTIVIGTQQWMEKNLDVMTYRNGDIIPQVTDATAWAGLTTGAWCYYNNDPLNGAIYGKLYNWYAVMDARGLAPQGWSIPNQNEWEMLATLLGGDVAAGGKMKTTGTTRWTTPNTNATNESGFSGLPGGNRNPDGSFGNVGNHCNWWGGMDFYLQSESTGRRLYSNNGNFYENYYNYRNGLSVRCIRD